MTTRLPRRGLRCRQSSSPLPKGQSVPSLLPLLSSLALLFLLFARDASGFVGPSRTGCVHGGAIDALYAAEDVDVRSDPLGGFPATDFSRRRILRGWAAASGAAAILSPPVGGHSAAALAAAEDDNFRSGAYGREEYTNSIVASRDTNISPREVYDSIESRYVRYPLDRLRESSQASGGRAPRALDVGAGAGVSTQVLWDVGYRSIDAVDWSGSAWERFVVDDPDGRCPSGVKFFELDDERYLDLWRSEGREKFDVIVFNFAVNEDKARLFARELLRPDNGRLLAPVNAQRDYWLKQTYKAFDSGGTILWSATDVGAWSVQFQPDVTQDTCQGIWCSPYNGFKKKR